MKILKPSLIILLSALCCASAVLADEVVSGEVDKPDVAISATKADSSKESFWDSVKLPFTSGKKESDVQKSNSDNKDTSQRESEKDSEPGLLGSITSTFSSGSESKHSKVKVIDIEKVSTLSENELDPTCKILVQPFGITDNALSLAKMAGNLEVSNKVSELTGKGTQISTPQIVKLAAKKLNWLPMSLEILIGQGKLDDQKALILPENKNKSSQLAYQNARKTLKDVLAQIHEDIPYDFKIFVIKKSTGNAQALPGGFILVDEDIVSGKKYDQEFAYFKIAHEVSHVLQRHQTRMYQARLADGIDTISNLNTLLNSTSGNPSAFLPYASSLKNLFVSFTESQELQADACAFRLMQGTLDHPHLIKEIHSIEKKLGPIAPQVAQTNKPMNAIDVLKDLSNGVFEKHPNTSQRQHNLEQMLIQPDLAKQSDQGRNLTIPTLSTGK